MQLLQYYLLWSYLLNLEGKYWNQLRLSLVRIERSKDSAAFDLLAERRQEYFDDFAITSEDITTFFYHIMHDFMIRFFFFFLLLLSNEFKINLPRDFETFSYVNGLVEKFEKKKKKKKN